MAVDGARTIDERSLGHLKIRIFTYAKRRVTADCRAYHPENRASRWRTPGDEDGDR
jgi:hypothetical protein